MLPRSVPGNSELQFTETIARAGVRDIRRMTRRVTPSSDVTSYATSIPNLGATAAEISAW